MFLRRRRSPDISSRKMTDSGESQTFLISAKTMFILPVNQRNQCTSQRKSHKATMVFAIKEMRQDAIFPKMPSRFQRILRMLSMNLIVRLHSQAFRRMLN
jgi:hypothetical protein